MRSKLLLLLPAALMFAACTSSSGTTDNYGSSSSSAQAVASAADSGSASSVTWDGSLLKGKQTVTIKTGKGDITLQLDADAAPKTVTNFVTLAKSGYYDNLSFHRVIPGFMIQGGDPKGNGTGGQSIFGETFEDEINAASPLYKAGYKTGVVAMANRGPDTNGSQFFIMDKDYPLPPNYTIFGRVTKGQDVVAAIARVESNPQTNMPLQPVTFTVEAK